MAAMPGFDAMRAQQEAFFKVMTGKMGPLGSSGPARHDAGGTGDDLKDIKRQLADLQSKLDQMQK